MTEPASPWEFSAHAQRERAPDLHPTPWSIVDHDARIVIVAANGATVTEVQPGQHLGHVPTREERRALAQRIVDAANHPTDAVARFTAEEMREIGVMAEPLRSPDAPWLNLMERYVDAGEPEAHRLADDGCPHHEEA